MRRRFINRGNARPRCAPQLAKLVDRRAPTSPLQAVSGPECCRGNHKCALAVAKASLLAISQYIDERRLKGRVTWSLAR